MTSASRSVRRYAVVGMANTVLDLALFSVFALVVGLAPLLAHTVSTFCVMTVSYFVNRAWVFDSAVTGFTAFARFVAVTLSTALLVQSAVIVSVLAVTDAWFPGLPAALTEPGAKVMAMGTGMVVNFLGYRWLFRHRARAGVSATPDSAAGAEADSEAGSGAGDRPTPSATP